MWLVYFEDVGQETFQIVFTLYRIVKRSVEESVTDRNAAFEAVPAREQYCSAPLRCWKWDVLCRVGF